MFESKTETPEQAADLRVVSCGPGTRAVGIVRGKLKLIASLGPGFPVSRMTLPLPQGRVISVDSDGPSCITADGTLWCWNRPENRWDRVASLRDDA